MKSRSTTTETATEGLTLIKIIDVWITTEIALEDAMLIDLILFMATRCIPTLIAMEEVEEYTGIPMVMGLRNTIIIIDTHMLTSMEDLTGTQTAVDMTNKHTPTSMKT